MHKFTDVDIKDAELVAPFVEGVRQDYQAVVLTTQAVYDGDTAMLFLTKGDLTSLLNLFNKEGALNE